MSGFSSTDNCHLITLSNTKATMTSALPAISTFPISSLPPELRHKIYAEYFRSLSPVPIAHSTITILIPSTTRSTVPIFTAKLHSHIISQTPLALANPIFDVNIPLHVILSNLTFSFTCACVMQILASLLTEINTKIRSVQILYGPLGRKTKD